MEMAQIKLLLCLLSVLVLVNGQACENYGFQNGSSCSCPTGFGGSTCSQPGCGGDIFQGTKRALVPPPPSGSFANLTTAGCTCESGWSGTGCNVCQSASACQSAYTASGNAPSSAQAASTGQDGQNQTLTCNTTPRVWAASQMSCQVNVSCRGFLALIHNVDHSPEPNTTSHLPSFIHPQYHSYTPALTHPSSKYNLLWHRRHRLRTTLLCRGGTVLLPGRLVHSGS